LVYAFACVVYVPLLYLVPKKEKEAATVVTWQRIESMGSVLWHLRVPAVFA